MGSDTGGAPPQFPRCPECGWDTAQPPLAARPANLRWRQGAVALCALALLAITATILARGSRTSTFYVSTGFGTFLQPGVSLDDIRALADGGSPASTGGLIEHILEVAKPRSDMTRNWAVEISFATPHTSRTEWRQVGWPTDWALWAREPVYEDAIHASGLKLAKTDPTARPLGRNESPSNPLLIPPTPRWDWQAFQLIHRPPPEETGGVFTTTTFNPAAMAAPLALLLAVWSLVGALIWLRERRTKHARLLHRVRILLVIGAGMAVAALGASRARNLHCTMWRNAPMKQMGSATTALYWTIEGNSRLSLSLSDIAALRFRPDGPRVLAREMLRAIGNPAQASGYLTVAPVADVVIDMTRSVTTMATDRFPVLSINREYYVRRPDFGTLEPVAHPAGFFVEFSPGAVQLIVAWGDPVRPTYVVTLSDMFWALLLGLWIAALAAWYILVGFTLRRLRRRHARGLCPRCAYPVAHVP